MKKIFKHMYINLLFKLYPNKLVYVHIPKCGGSSLRAALRSKYIFKREELEVEYTYALSRNINNFVDSYSHLKWGRELRKNILGYYLDQGQCFITGHCPINEKMVQAYNNYHFVTVLRNPIDRFISHYKYSYKSGLHGNIEEDLDTFLETERARDLGRLMCIYLGVKGDGTDILNSLTCFGFTDDMSTFSKNLKKELNIKISINHENKGDLRHKLDEFILTESQMRKIEKICIDDLVFYNKAIEVHNERFDFKYNNTCL